MWFPLRTQVTPGPFLAAEPPARLRIRAGPSLNQAAVRTRTWPRNHPQSHADGAEATACRRGGSSRPVHVYSEDHVRAHVFMCMLACHVEWHMRRDLAPVLFEDDDRAGARARRSSPVEPARVSESAKAKASDKRTSDGLPVHGFTTHLADLGRLTLNHAFLPGRPDSRFMLASEPTKLQERAFELLGMDPDRDDCISVTAWFRPKPQSCMAESVFAVGEVPVSPCGMPTEFCRAHRAPTDAIARLVQAPERTLEPLGMRQQRILAYLGIVHHEFICGKGPQAQLAIDLRRAESLGLLVQHKPTDLAAMALGPCPDNEHIGKGRNGNSRLCAIQHITSLHLFGAGFHAAMVRILLPVRSVRSSR